MSADLTLSNAAIWFAQVAIVVGIAAALWRVLRIDAPRARLGWLYAILLVSLLLPFVQSPREMPAASGPRTENVVIENPPAGQAIRAAAPRRSQPPAWPLPAAALSTERKRGLLREGMDDIDRALRPGGRLDEDAEEDAVTRGARRLLWRTARGQTPMFPSAAVMRLSATWRATPLLRPGRTPPSRWRTAT